MPDTFYKVVVEEVQAGILHLTSALYSLAPSWKLEYFPWQWTRPNPGSLIFLFYDLDQARSFLLGLPWALLIPMEICEVECEGVTPLFFMSGKPTPERMEEAWQLWISPRTGHLMTASCEKPIWIRPTDPQVYGATAVKLLRPVMRFEHSIIYKDQALTTWMEDHQWHNAGNISPSGY